MQKGNKMGFDLTAQDPQTEEGSLFRNNIWYWRPLWEFVYMYCQEEIERDLYESGHMNDGALVPSETAIKIGTKLQALILDGTVKGFEKRYETARKNKTDLVPAASYPFSADNVQDFSEFCINSGGFKIY